MPRSNAPPPTRWMPWKMMSWASSGGAPPRQSTAAVMIWRTWSSTAPRSSPGESTTVLGMPVISSRPRTSALTSSAVGRGRPDGQLDLLRRALADGDAVLAAHIGLDGGVDVEPATSDRLGARRCRRAR